MFPKILRPSAVLLTLALLSIANAELKIDFNSNQDGGGSSTTAGDPGLSAANHNQSGWLSYHANHEVAAEFTTANYGGITVTPAWPNAAGNMAMQSIDRGAGNDGNWDDTAGDLNLVTDFIGIDTRTGNHGNGDWDGTTGTPTYMTLTIGGLLAGNYKWTSFHHDTENVHGPFAVWISTDGGASFTQLADGVMTDSTTGGNPASPGTEIGPDAYTLTSTYRTLFTANGVDDVVLRFAPYSSGAVHRQIWGMNGFEIVDPSVASNPTPADGSQVPPTDTAEDGRIYMVMAFEPGDGAISHSAYFSDNYDDVANHVAGANIGAPPFSAMPTSYFVGLDDSNLPDHAREDIQGGITYYWTVVESDGVEDFPGPVWRYTIIPAHAWGPTPTDGDARVNPDPNATTSWQIGSVDTTDTTVSYDVYYGSILADVEAETSAVVRVSDTTAEIGPLESNTTYHWKVNTVLTLIRPPFTETAITGEIWQFTTLPTVPIEDEDLVGWWKLDGDIVPGMAFDSSGHANHGTLTGDPQWVTGKVDGALEFDGVDDIVVVKQNSGLPIYNNGTDNAYSITMWVKGGPQPDRRIFSEGSSSNSNPLFNLGTQNTGATGQFDVYIRPVGMNHTYSVAEPFDDTWHHIAWVDANGTATLYIDGAFDGGDYNYARATLALNTTSIGGILRAAASHFFAGQIDDVRTYKRTLSAKEIKILAGRLGSSSPDPSNGATDVSRTPALTWSPGAFAAAANGNEFYFSENLSDVQNRTTAKVTLTTPTYDVLLTLGLGKTYYWVVDTVNGVDSWPGDIWSFTTVGWLPVDDMESYTPWTTIGNDIFTAWRDGLGDCTPGNGNLSGANVTENPNPVFEGIQSMKYDYDNDGTVYSPCDLAPLPRPNLYSKIEAQVAGLISGIGTDWETQGVRALSLRFQGVATNGIEPMWVQLQDGTKTYGAKVTYGDYDDEDPADIADEAWHEWFIDMGDFGVDLGDVVSISIGIGTEGAAIPGGSGTVYFDDIRLYTPKCMPQRAKPAADFDNSCQVDYGDVDILFDNWLLQDIPETPMSGAWQNTDIGDVNQPGSFINVGGGAYSLTADGADIWNQADAFHFAFQPLSGDGRFTANVTNIGGPGTNGWRKAGVMIRQSLDPNSPNAFMAISGGSGGGETFQWRSEKGGSSQSSHTTTGIAPPTCVRIVRIGDTFAGFYYRDGEWIQEGNAVTVPMSENVYIGLALTSHDINAMCTATFDRTCSDEFVPMDIVEDKVINFIDYANLMQTWLEEVKYPQ